jgi:hypothetical protein
MPLTISRKHEEKLSLLMLRKTRFGWNFIMMNWLLQVKTTLQQSVVDPQLVTYVTGLRDTCTVMASTIFRKVKEIVLYEHF